MYIFDDIVWEKKGGKEHIHIGKPCDFYGRKDNPDISDIDRSNNVCDKAILTSRLDEIEMVKKDASVLDYTVSLADKNSMLRGYGGGLAYVGNFVGMDNVLFLPQRDIYSPRDRLVWDICAGKTQTMQDSYNWLHGIIVEGLKELSIVHNDRLLLPQVTGTNVDVVTKTEANGIISKHALGLLHLRPFATYEVNMEYIPPANAAKIHQIMEDGKIIEFDAGWCIETKFSGLELMAYGLIDFRMSYTSNLYVYDSEESAPGVIGNREIHEIRPVSGEVLVYRAGSLIRASTIDNEVNKRAKFRNTYDYSNDKPGQLPIPKYTATFKADRLTKKDSWPFGTDISKLLVLEYRG